jgi:hypothetical protein
MRKFCKKNNQSGFVILGLIKFSIKMLLPKLDESAKFFESLKGIVETLNSRKQDITFEKFKRNILSSIENGQYEETQHLILNYDYGLEDIEYRGKGKKVLSLNDPDRISTESSSKDNKLEISVNNTIMHSSRSLKIVSPVSLKSASSIELKAISHDHIGFSRIGIKLPVLRLAVDITMSAHEIRKLFISEMNRYI